MFDSQIQPVVLYGSELWGLDKKVIRHCESLHLFGLKRFLGVDRKTPNDLVYGETNRFPIYINSAVRCVRYWLKLLKMNSDRLPRKSYEMLYDLDLKGKHNWVSNIRMCLFELGFGYIWIYQEVGQESLFIQNFRQRLIDCRWQNWECHIKSSDRFDLYREYTSTHLVKHYLLCNMDRHIRVNLTRFRIGISEINKHKYRYKNVHCSLLLCPLCKEATEDEVHFVLQCRALSKLRVKFIPKKYYVYPCLFRFCLLMATNNERTQRNLALYLYKAFRLRETLTS